LWSIAAVGVRPGQEIPSAFDQPVISAHRPAGDVVLRAVHSLPPSSLVAASWRSGLANLQTWRERQPADQPLVMAGDFSSSFGCPEEGCPQGCVPTIVGQNGPVTTSLSFLVARSASGAVDALGPVVAAGPFGVGKSLAVILVASAFLLGAMVVGGHLGDASRRRKSRRKRH